MLSNWDTSYRIYKNLYYTFILHIVKKSKIVVFIMVEIFLNRQNWLFHLFYFENSTLPHPFSIHKALSLYKDDPYVIDGVLDRLLQLKKTTWEVMLSNYWYWEPIILIHHSDLKNCKVGANTIGAPKQRKLVTIHCLRPICLSCQILAAFTFLIRSAVLSCTKPLLISERVTKLQLN